MRILHQKTIRLSRVSKAIQSVARQTNTIKKMKYPAVFTSIALTLSSVLIIQCDSETLESKARRIHQNVITLDTHDDINVGFFKDSLNYSQDTDTQINLPKMKAGGLDVSWLIVYTGQDSLNALGYEKAAANAQAKFNAIHRLVEVYAPEQIELALTAADVKRIWKAGKKVAMIGVENAYPLALDTANVRKFFDQGARYMSLAHNGHSQFSDSNTGEYDSIFLHNGISPLGKQVIEKMNYYGILVDLSHPSKEAIRQTIAHSKAPVIASHSSARALCDHPRNLDDEQLEWIKTNGGVVQTVAFSAYLNTEKHEAYAAAKDSLLRALGTEKGFAVLTRKEARALPFDALQTYTKGYKTMVKEAQPALVVLKKEVPPVDVSDLVDHIDYLVAKMGLEHVGISSDFDGGGGIEGWQDASETFNVTLELVKRGYSEEAIGKLWSGNLLRVLEEARIVAEKLQTTD